MLVLFGSSAVLDTTVGHTMDVVSPVSFPGESCQRNVTDLAVGRVAGRRAGYSKGPTTEHGTPVSRYEQLMAAGGPQTHTHTHTRRSRYSAPLQFAVLHQRSVLFFSRPGSEGWPHRGRTFSIYLCPLSF